MLQLCKKNKQLQNFLVNWGLFYLIYAMIRGVFSIKKMKIREIIHELSIVILNQWSTLTRNKGGKLSKKS